jgi:hypothetical protein
MALDSFQKWDGRGVFLLRLDWGYCVSDAGDPELDAGAVSLEHLPLHRVEELLRGPAWRAGCRVLKGADRLAALGRRRGVEEAWGALALAARADGILLVARFPRVAEVLGRSLQARGLLAGYAENDAAGELPPLYASLDPAGELFHLNLAYEWETGMARARATTVLAEAGALMARRGSTAPAELGRALGATAGAARSYLNWMTDAGLARRMAQGFALRHPALGALFQEAPRPVGGIAPVESRPAVPPVPRRPAENEQTVPNPPRITDGGRVERPVPRWDPSELD